MDDGQTLLCVEFYVPARSHATLTERALRDRVISELQAEGLILIGVGSGNDWLGFTFRVLDKEKASRIVGSTMARTMPYRRYKISEIEEGQICPTAR